MFKKIKRFKEKEYKENPYILTNETNFNITEAYKIIRANINFFIASQRCKKIMICSAYTRDNNTTVCANLAVAIAQTGASVLLIDYNLRKAEIHKFFGVNNDSGISGYLSDTAKLEDIIKETGIDNLYVITSGIIPPNPAELLANSKMRELFAEVENIIDYIVIDTPPICAVSDVLPLSKLCDGVVLLVSHMKTTHPHIKESLERLKFAGANVIGIILNKIR